jgi:folate-binding protein YgfZ
MNPDWQNFLLQHNAVIAQGIAQHFGDNTSELCATTTETVVCDLSQFGLLRVSGEEAQAFLQNLLSNDIREVDATNAQLSSLNSAKGRMLASLLVWRDGADFMLQLPGSLAEPICKKLSLYVLRAKVKISDASNDVIALGIAGASAQEVLNKQFAELPASPYSGLTSASGYVLKINDMRYQVFANPSQAQMLWDALCHHTRPVGSSSWDWLNIRSGIPIILPQTQEQFVAQMVNFDVLGGINFKKGCYPGQEIVARTHYLGKLKRRMYLAHLDTTETPQAGDELFSADMEGQASGIIANVVAAPEGGYDMLTVVQMASLQTHPIHWRSLQGAALQFLPLPYLIPTA